MEQLRKWRGTRRTEQVADWLGVTPAMWSRWETGSRVVPGRRVLEIEALTGISRHVLRPDIFGPTPKRGAAA